MSGNIGTQGMLSAKKRALLELLLREEFPPGNPERVPRRTKPGPVPQSFAQRRLWMLEALRPGTPVYTIRTAVRLTGLVNYAALSCSVSELLRRHESLRTTFTAHEGLPVQIIAPASAVDLPIVDVPGATAEEREAAALHRSNEEASRPFDLEAGPLFRPLLLRLEATQHLLLVMLHHIVADGWSLGILLREFSALYTAFASGETPDLPEPPIQYGDYAIWQHEAVTQGAFREQLAYWTKQLTDLPALTLRTDRPRPPIAGTAGERQHVILSRGATEALTAFSQREGATLFMTLLAAFEIVLARWSGQDDFGVGTPIANRTRAETEGVVGFFLNTLVLRADLSGDPTFRVLLGRVRETTLLAYAHQDLPFERLLEAIRLPRDPARMPLFQSFFNLLNFSDENLNRPVVVADAPPEADVAQFDLTLYAGEYDHRLQLQLVYRTELFDTATAARLLAHLSTLLDHLVQNADRRVSALPFVPPEERRRLAGRRNAAIRGGGADTFGAEPNEQSVADCFREQARRHARRIAVRSPGTQWTYGELDARVDLIAQAVRGCAPHGSGRIALLCAHDAAVIAASLGVLRSGHAYVPLDTAHPPERLAGLLVDAEVQAIVADRRNMATARALAADRLAVIDAERNEEDAGGAALPASSPDDVAYLLYTSGSTGRPKGVIQNHRNLLHHIRAYSDSLGIQPEDRLSLVASYSFDAAVMDTFGALLNGATLCLFDLRHEGAHALLSWLGAERVTIYHSTPTVYRQAFGAADARMRLPSLRAVVLGGEEVTSQDVQSFRRCCPPGCLFVNGFGPTESTLALQYFVDANTRLSTRTVPLGYPVENTDVLLLNESGEEVDVYGAGTIFVRSRHVALGYWQRPELTRAAFRPSPADARVRLYNSGDLGRLLPDGAIEYAGRRDRQIKIRGQRVEIGEIEARLLEHASVRAAVVTDTTHPRGETVLAGYVVLRDTHSAADGELRAFLRESLPEHMVPAAIVVLSALPLTVTGKVDRARLPAPQFPSRSTPASPGPRSDLELTLASLFSSVLGLDDVGIDDDFFELGGHSLLATQLLARVRSVLHVDVPLRAIFEQSTVSELARYVARIAKTEGDRCAPIVPLPRNRPRANAEAL